MRGSESQCDMAAHRRLINDFDGCGVFSEMVPM